ncbi:MAG TPA: pentapeptide repeat-containing protein [Microbacterium sp.]|nr:pentapeptide repeat-containing protein [Microbacterium sp.]
MADPPLPLPPQVSAPDLPPRLEEGPLPARGGESFQMGWTALNAETDAAHARITECEICEASVDRLDLTGATLIDVEVRALRATTLTARSARLRRVRIVGGRIGTLDLADADLDEVELRGVRIDYVSLAAARISDLLVADTTLGTLDLPQATVSRVAFTDCRADDVDTRGIRAKDLDLRGLEAVSYLDPGSLRGAALSARQVEHLAPALARALGIRVID